MLEMLRNTEQRHFLLQPVNTACVVVVFVGTAPVVYIVIVYVVVVFVDTARVVYIDIVYVVVVVFVGTATVVYVVIVVVFFHKHP